MTVNIEILKSGRLIKTMRMGNGTYVIGRDPAADIVLDSKTISKKHATLVIDNDTFRISDNRSANGIYFQGQKISEKAFKSAFQVELQPFTIQTAAKDNPDSFGKDGFSLDVIGAVLNKNIKAAFFVVIALVMFFSLLIVYIPLKKSAESISQEERLQNGILLSRYLAEMNRPFLETTDYGHVRTSPVRREDGVLYAFVLDRRGRIIAPHDQQGDFFNWDGLTQALKDARVKVENRAGEETLIFSPIVYQDQTLGAAVIGFSTGNAGTARSVSIGGTAVFLLVIVFGLSIMISYLLFKSFIRPFQLFYNEVELSIKEGRDQIRFQAPYEELENLNRIVNRLLLRKIPANGLPGSMNEPADYGKIQPPEGKPVQGEMGPDDNSPLFSTENRILDALPDPWCIVDIESYILVQISDTFVRDMGLSECREGMHIIEAFDSNIILTVTQLIENPDAGTVETQISNKLYKVRRVNQNKDKALVLIVFKEKG